MIEVVLKSYHKNCILLFLLISTVVQTMGQNSYTYSQPQNLTDGWETTSLIAQKVDTNLIYKLFNQFQEKKHQIHSIILVKDNKLILEEYFGENSLDVQHDLRSVTKSITSLLMGIAIEKGFIQSLDDPISKYLKNPKPTKNLDPRKDQITIKNLLTMSTGLDCNDWDQDSEGQEDRIYKKKDWIQYFLNLRMINKPGSVSTYCSMGTVVAAEIIERASGMSIDKFAQQLLFDPMGISNISWGHTSNKKVISSGKRIYMTSRDLAKIGQLVLNKGRWNQDQIVTATWIEKATSSKTSISGIDYGFLWWNFSFKTGTGDFQGILATGNGGQYIMIFPDYDLVCIFTGGAYNSEQDKLPFVIMNKVFIPTFITK